MATPLTAYPGLEIQPTFSPDGNEVAFVRGPEERSSGIYLIPALGGPERRVADVAPVPETWELRNSALAWTADGKWLIVADRPEGEPAGLFLLSPENGEKRRLTSHPRYAPGPTAVFNWADADPAVSPDGRTLAFSRRLDLGDSDLFLLPLGAASSVKGPPARVTFENRVALSPVWTSDGADLVFSLGSWLSERQLSRLGVGTPSAGRAPRLPVSVGGDATNLAYSARSHRLVFSRNQNRQNIYRVALPRPGVVTGEPAPLIASTRFDHHPDYSPAA